MDKLTLLLNDLFYRLVTNVRLIYLHDTTCHGAALSDEMLLLGIGSLPCYGVEIQNKNNILLRNTNEIFMSASDVQIF